MTDHTTILKKRAGMRTIPSWVDAIAVALLAWFDYGVITGWQWVFQHKYLCVDTSDHLSQYCGISWDMSPFPEYIITFLAIGITGVYLLYLVDKYILPFNIYF